MEQRLETEEYAERLREVEVVVDITVESKAVRQQ
jgi:hypothetical protein